MGTCCGKESYSEHGIETALGGDLNNLLISTGDQDYIKERQVIMKNMRLNLKAQLEAQADKLGKKMRMQQFLSLIPEEIKESFFNPFEKEVSNEQLEELIQYDPIELPNGDVYYGYWNKDLEKEGPGQLIQTNKKTYIYGLFQAGKLYKGKIISPLGEYIGEIENFIPNGKGKFIPKNGNTYEGEFVKGIKEGNGTLLFPDGSKYWGAFTNDVINGEGEFIWNNGYYYKGEIQNGMINGNGVLKGPNGSKYTGTFKNGIFHGKGKFIWGDSNINTKDKNSFLETYMGEYNNGKKEGKGTYQLMNGDFFSGTFFADKQHGRGELETNDTIYRALWKNGQIAEQPQIEKKELVDDYIPTGEHNLNFQVRKEDLDIKNCNYLNFELLGK